MPATDSRWAMVVVPVVVWPIEIHAYALHLLAAGDGVIHGSFPHVGDLYVRTNGTWFPSKCVTVRNFTLFFIYIRMRVRVERVFGGGITLSPLQWFHPVQ